MADLPALRALVEQAYRGDAARQGWTHEADLLEGERTSDADLAGAIAHPGQALLVAEDGGRLVGTVTVTVTASAPGLAYLGMLAVAPDLQGSGLGRRLIAAAEQAARERFAATRMEMTVIDRRAELIDWYRRRGYRPTGEVRPFPGPLPQPPAFAMVVLERALG